MCMMLGNKYLLDERYERARDEYVRCYAESGEKVEALLLALFCCAKMGDLRAGRNILYVLGRAGEKRAEVHVPLRVGESFGRDLQSFMGDEERSFSIAYNEGKIRFFRKDVENRE